MKGSLMLKTFGIAVGSGLVFGVIAALIGLIAAPTLGLHDSFVGYLAGAFWGFLIGYPIGPIIGLFLVNRLLHYRGSSLYGTLSIIIGGAVVVGIVYIIELLTYGPYFKAPAWTAAAVLFYFLEPPLLGTLGFHLGYRKGEGD